MENKKESLSAIAVAIAGLIIFGLFMLAIFGDEDFDFEYHDSFSEIGYIMPDEFDEEFVGEEYANYSYNDEDELCYVRITAHDKQYIYNFDDLEGLFKESITYTLNDKVGEVTKVKINNNEGLYVDKITDYSTTHYYGFETANYYYILEYQIYDDSHGDNALEDSVCYSSLDKILSSIKIK